jgi:hypothetical protein
MLAAFFALVGIMQRGGKVANHALQRGDVLVHSRGVVWSDSRREGVIFLKLVNKEKVSKGSFTGG